MEALAPKPHHCGATPATSGAQVKCPLCGDVTVRKSLAEAVAAWNKQQGQLA